MTDARFALGLGVREFGYKLAAARVRQYRAEQGIASLELLTKGASAAELPQQELGAGTRMPPHKPLPAPKLGKPLPSPASSSTTRLAMAHAACRDVPRRGEEPELTEKLRQDAEAQTPMADGDVAAKVAVSKDWLRRGIEAPRRALDTALEVGSIGRPGPGTADIAALRGRLADLGDRLADSQHPLAQYAQGIADTEGAVLRGMHRDLVDPRVGWRL